MYRSGDLVYCMGWGPYRITQVIDLWGRRKYNLTGVYWGAFLPNMTEDTLKPFLPGDKPYAGEDTIIVALTPRSGEDAW